MLVLRVGVEHVEQGLLRKVGHLLFYRLGVPDGVAFWQVEAGHGRFGRRIVKEGEALLREFPVDKSAKRARDHQNGPHSLSTV